MTDNDAYDRMVERQKQLIPSLAENRGVVKAEVVNDEPLTYEFTISDVGKPLPKWLADYATDPNWNCEQDDEIFRAVFLVTREEVNRQNQMMTEFNRKRGNLGPDEEYL